MNRHRRYIDILLRLRRSTDGDVFGWHDEKREDLVDCRRLAVVFLVELRVPPDTRIFFQRCKNVFLNSYVENKVLGGPELTLVIISSLIMLLIMIYENHTFYEYHPDCRHYNNHG